MKTITRIWLFLFIISVSLYFWNCSAPTPSRQYIKDGKQYGTVQGTFRHRWWNYYERGLSFAEGEFFPEAIADFQAAITQREADQRMARTYGMHFVDYFPHRELGIALFETGKLLPAQQELELSLSQYPTAKARYYLDRVRQAIIRRQRISVLPPVIRLDTNQAEIWTRDDPYVLSGMVEDDNYVTGLSIRGAPIFFEASTKRLPFREFMSLGQGTHTIKVIATNLAGLTSEETLQIRVDRAGPLITLAEIEPQPAESGKHYRINGSIYDEAGVRLLTINGVAAAIEKAPEVFFSEMVTPDGNQVELLARDRLGNKTVARITLQPGIRIGQIPLLLANAASDRRPLLLAAIFKPKDTQPPVIQVKDWTRNQTVYLKKVIVDGYVRDHGQIVELTVNGNSILRRPGTMIFFNHFADLKPGENVLTIAAADRAGNRTRKEIIINRQIPLALKLDQRMSLTVMPFAHKGEISPAGMSYQDNLIYALVNRNRFRVVERGLLENILQEQKLSRTSLIDRETALRMGRLAAARSIITGSIIESRSGIEIIARFIDTESSEILDAEDVYSEGKDLAALKSMAEAMALKFHRRFPLVGGIIIARENRIILTDMGEKKIGIQKRLIVYRDKPVHHPVSGKMLGSDSRIMGQAVVKQVNPEITKAELVDPVKAEVDRLDKVITE